MRRLFFIILFITNFANAQQPEKLPVVETGSNTSDFALWQKLDFYFHNKSLPDEKWIIFRANFDGHSYIYAVSLEKAIN